MKSAIGRLSGMPYKCSGKRGPARGPRRSSSACGSGAQPTVRHQPVLAITLVALCRNLDDMPVVETDGAECGEKVIDVRFQFLGELSGNADGGRDFSWRGLADVRRAPTFYRSLRSFPARLQRNTDHFRLTPYQQAVSPYQGKVRCRSLFSRAARLTRDVRKPCKPGRAGSACRLEAEDVRLSTIRADQRIHRDSQESNQKSAIAG